MNRVTFEYANSVKVCPVDVFGSYDLWGQPIVFTITLRERSLDKEALPPGVYSSSCDILIVALGLTSRHASWGELCGLWFARALGTLSNVCGVVCANLQPLLGQMRDAEHKGRARKCKNLIGFSDFNFLPKTNNCFWHIQYRLNLRSWRWAVCWQCIFREPDSVWFLCMGSVVNTAGIKSSNLRVVKTSAVIFLTPSYNTTLLSNIPREAIQSLPKHLRWWGIYWLAYQKPQPFWTALKGYL